MQILTYFYALPSLIFAAISLLWVANRSLSRPLALLPVASCYVMGVFLLIAGGCHRVAHVRLEGFEADLVSRDGAPRELAIGGPGPSGESPFVEVPGYPPDALRLGFANDGLRLRAGGGYQREIVVRSGPDLVPVRDGLPVAIALKDGDRIEIGARSGGGYSREWVLGTEPGHLTPLSDGRWRVVGQAGVGVARISGYGPEAFRLRLTDAGKAVEFRAGDGLTKDVFVSVDGQAMDPSEFGNRKIPYRRGETSLVLAPSEPLVGWIDLNQAAFLNRRAALHWKTAAGNPVARAVPFQLAAGEKYSVGGAVNDDIYVKGLPAETAWLEGVGDSGVTLTLSGPGRELQRRGELEGRYPQEAREGGNLRLGGRTSPVGGIFQLIRVVAETRPGPPEDSPSERDVPGEPVESEEVSGETVVAGAPGPEAQSPVRFQLVWLPNGETKWVLPNRTVVVPLLNVSFDVFTRRPWKQRVYPLNGLAPVESGLRSCLVYGFDHPEINGAHLLAVDPDIAVYRGRDALAVSPDGGREGALRNDARIEFLQLVTRVEEGGGASPAGVPRAVTLERLALRETFAAFGWKTRRVGKNDIPVVEVRFHKPEIQGIPMRDIYRDAKARRADHRKVAFGVNEARGFSNLPHQIRFRSVSDWFARANAEITLNMFSVEAQDDYRHQKIDYGEPFTVGGDRRLRLRAIKQTIPWKAVFAMIGAGGLILLLGHGLARSFYWAALLFGIAFLTVSRVLFAQTALVNPPYDGAVLRVALATLFLAPLAVVGGGLAMRHGAAGRLNRWLNRIDEGVSYRFLAWGIVFLAILRTLLLLAGFKESIDLGVRVAFSIFFVPAYLVLFSLGCACLFRERRADGAFRPGAVARFFLFAFFVSMAQIFSALLVSDLGLILYLIPQGIVLAAVGAGIAIESMIHGARDAGGRRAAGSWFAAGTGILLMAPLTAISLVFVSPKSVVNAIPGLREKLESETDIATGSTLLRVLQFVDENYLINLGTDAAERIAQDHAITRNYARRGMDGEGYLQVDIVPAKRGTALNDSVSAVFIFGQFGVIGALAVAIAYLAVALAASAPGFRIVGAVGWFSVMAGTSFAMVSIYMMASNYGLLPFTGRTIYLLGLDSFGADVVESLVLLSLIVVGLSKGPANREGTRTVENAGPQADETSDSPDSIDPQEKKA